jgi:hypothetical protein
MSAGQPGSSAAGLAPEAAPVDEHHGAAIGELTLLGKRVETPPEAPVDEDRRRPLAEDVDVEISHGAWTVRYGR